jgi:hypothetical protein
MVRAVHGMYSPAMFKSLRNCTGGNIEIWTINLPSLGLVNSPVPLDVFRDRLHLVFQWVGIPIPPCNYLLTFFLLSDRLACLV